jgi:hypothetical protein
MAVGKGRMKQSMQRLAQKSQRYYESAAPMAFSKTERDEAGEADVQQRTGQTPPQNTKI